MLFTLTSDTMFTLPPLSPNPRSITPLSTVEARFSLPQLNEDAPGVERLLGTLGRRSIPIWGSEKGEVVSDADVIEDVDEYEEETREAEAGDADADVDADADIWLRAGEATSKPKTFQVSERVKKQPSDTR